MGVRNVFNQLNPVDALPTKNKRTFNRYIEKRLPLRRRVNVNNFSD